MIGKLTAYWHAHGTKILGIVVMLLGAAGDSLSVIQAADPKHAALWALVIGLGGAIVRRGFTNSARAATLPPPDPGAARS